MVVAQPDLPHQILCHLPHNPLVAEVLALLPHLLVAVPLPVPEVRGPYLLSLVPR